MMEIWHIRAVHSRAFCNPVFIWEKAYLFCRGWRPFNDYWWSKPSRVLRRILEA